VITVSHYAPLQQLKVDLANNTVARYNWITPDQFNDSHTALANGFTYHGVHYTGDQASIAQGDNFLSIVVPMIESSQAYKNNGAIIIWWDETEGGDDSAHTLEEIVATCQRECLHQQPSVHALVRPVDNGTTLWRWSMSRWFVSGDRSV